MPLEENRAAAEMVTGCVYGYFGSCTSCCIVWLLVYKDALIFFFFFFGSTEYLSIGYLEVEAAHDRKRLQRSSPNRGSNSRIVSGLWSGAAALRQRPTAQPSHVGNWDWAEPYRDALLWFYSLPEQRSTKNEFQNFSVAVRSFPERLFTISLIFVLML